MICCDSLHNNSVRPFHQRDKYRRVSVFCSPLIQVCFRDPTGPGAGSSSKNRNMFRYNLFQGFTQWRPSNRQDRVHHRLSQQRRGLSKKKDLYFVTSFCEHQPVRERKCCPRRVIWSPRALHHNFRDFLDSCTFVPNARKGKLASCAKNVRRAIRCAS